MLWVSAAERLRGGGVGWVGGNEQTKDGRDRGGGGVCQGSSNGQSLSRNGEEATPREG